MPVSVIIPVKNGAKRLDACLNALRKQKTGEIIVVDNGSNDDSVKIARKHKAKVISSKGFVGEARNKGAEAAKYGKLAFLDSDCIVPEGWLKLGKKLLREHDVVIGEYTSPVNNWIGNLVTSLTTIKTASGATLMNADVFNKFKYDPGLISGEDIDISIRLEKQGVQIHHDPKLDVVHLGEPTTIKEYLRKQFWYGKSFPKLMKHGMDKRLIRPYTAVSTTLSAFVLLISSIYKPQFLLPAVLLLVVPPFFGAIMTKSYRQAPAITILGILYGITRTFGLFAAAFSSR